MFEENTSKGQRRLWAEAFMKNAHILSYNFQNFHSNSGKTVEICFSQWVKFNTDVNTIKPLFCGCLPVGRTPGSGCYLPGPWERWGWGREQNISRNSLPHQLLVSSRMRCERTGTWLPPHTLLSPSCSLFTTGRLCNHTGTRLAVWIPNDCQKLFFANLLKGIIT